MNGSSRRTLRRLALGATAIAAVAVPAATAMAAAPDPLWANAFLDTGYWNIEDFATAADGSSWIFSQFDNSGSVTAGNVSLSTPTGNYSVFALKAGPTGQWATGATPTATNSTNTRYGGVVARADGSATMLGSGDSSLQFGSSPAISGAFATHVTNGGTFGWLAQGNPNGSDFSGGSAIAGTSDAIIGGSISSGVAPQFGSTTIPSSGANRGMLARLDADGRFAWAIASGSGGTVYGNGARAFADGTGVMTGGYQGTPTFGSTTLPAPTDGNWDLVVAKGGATGWEWATSAQITGNSQYLGLKSTVATTDAGETIVTGTFTGTATFGSLPPLTATGPAQNTYIAKVSASGTWMWARKIDAYSSVSWLNLTSAASLPGPEGTILQAGVFTGSFTVNTVSGPVTLTSAGSTDIYLAGLARDGEYLWATRFGSADGESNIGLTAIADGSVTLAGYAQSSIVFSPTITVSPNRGGYIVRYLMPPGGVPAAVSATPGDRTATVSWVGVQGPNISKYIVTASNGATCEAVAPATSCTVAGLEGGKTYTFTVKAVNSAGSGPASASASATPTSTTPAEQKAADADPSIALPAAVVLRGATLLAAVRPSVAGTVRVTVTLRGRGVGTVTTKATTAGRMRVAVPLSRWARAQIRRGPVTLRVTTRLTDGAGKTATASRTVKAGRVTPVVPVTG